MPSLEDLTPEARDELALLARELAENPSTRENFLRLTKQARPSMTIDAIDMKDTIDAKSRELQDKYDALENKMREREAVEELERRRQALIEKGKAKSKDDVKEIEKVMLEKGIQNHETAADYYDAAFASNSKIEIPFRAANNNHVFHQYTLILHDINRDALHQFLAEKGVPSMIYYPVPAHRQKMFDAFGGNEFDLPVTDWLTERVISLPIHTELDTEQQDFIIAKVLEFLQS